MMQAYGARAYGLCGFIFLVRHDMIRIKTSEQGQCTTLEH
uniref:Uncharacterized protein n=1 Tax=Rhizophora mucronata TaxID=61149 RepID=A0A2P2PSS5_RHIMU